jgi:hypothetical protein
MDTLFGIVTSFLIGIGLAASCGFRVFVPMLVMCLAVRAGFLQLSEGWHWMGSWPAVVAFSVASIAEIIGFYIPWVDHALDAVAVPAAVIAGTIATAACVADMHPLLKWSAAIIAGGGIAGAIQASTVFVRGASTATTGGLGNWVVSTLELVTSFILSVLAIVVPILTGLLVAAIVFFVVRRFLRRRAKSAVVAPAGAGQPVPR